MAYKSSEYSANIRPQTSSPPSSPSAPSALTNQIRFMTQLANLSIPFGLVGCVRLTVPFKAAKDLKEKSICE